MSLSRLTLCQVIREGWDNKTKGYGFVSFLDPFDCAKAIREKNGKYLGYRYIWIVVTHPLL
jgi:RNA recognition motif-containing protein